MQNNMSELNDWIHLFSENVGIQMLSFYTSSSLQLPNSWSRARNMQED